MMDSDAMIRMRFGESSLNDFYLDILRDSFGEMNVPVVQSRQKTAVVTESNKVSFNRELVEKWYRTPPQNGYFRETIATKISQQLQALFNSPGHQAYFAFAQVKPWERSRPGMCYKNTGDYCRAFPAYESVYVYTIYDRGSYYELEPHTLVKKRSKKKALDITPTLEVLQGNPSLKKICYVSHPTIQQFILSTNALRLQYGFIVVKT